jgi:hypothetical protein
MGVHRAAGMTSQAGPLIHSQHTQTVGPQAPPTLAVIGVTQENTGNGQVIMRALLRAAR